MLRDFETVRSREVAKAARERLRKSPYQAVRHVGCECDGGVLFLRGRVPSYYQKQLVQETVSELSAVADVVNETEVISEDG